MKIILKNEKTINIDKSLTLFDIIKFSDNNFKKNETIIVAKINGKLVDLSTNVKDKDEIEFFTLNSKEGLETYRHSSAHIMAEAVGELFDNVKFGIGPIIKNGFYYDFDINYNFVTEDLKRIEDKIIEIIKKDMPFIREEISKEKALKYFSEKGEKYKVELIKSLPKNEKITIYKQGGFIDLCRGPHMPSTGYLKAFKLMNIAGAYWRGNEKNKMLQRIYATSFSDKKKLKEYLELLEESKKRDHRKLGAELNLFIIKEESPGMPIFLPKGMVLKNQLENYMRSLYEKWDYQEIRTPIILNKKLWEKSGHWEHYHENMYFTEIDKIKFAIKPMNCPGCMLVYKNKQHSYKEFPIRYAEFGLVHRHEKSGVLHGLMRARSFTQDDAHIFISHDQIKTEIKNIINMVNEVYGKFDFKYNIELSTKPEKAMGSNEIWEKAICSLKEALQELSVDYNLNEGGGAFYGPKIDFHLNDSLGRNWQCGTIQLDFQMPEKFQLKYIGKDGSKHVPVIIHRTIFGSIERFIAILIEHYAGFFPIWLSPIQIKILPISESHHKYSSFIAKLLRNKKIRVDVDYRNENLNYKIREGKINKIPYLFIIGNNEEKNKTISICEYGKKDKRNISINLILEELNKKNKY